MKLKNLGFSLVELMVAVVIVAILAAIAMPSYNNYLVRSARSAAQSELLTMAALQEKIYLNSNAYTPNITGSYNGSAASSNSEATGGLGKSTGKTADGKYTLSLDISAPSQTYEMKAVPAAGKAQVGDGCILVRENGLRQWHQGSDACAAGSPIAW